VLLLIFEWGLILNTGYSILDSG